MNFAILFLKVYLNWGTLDHLCEKYPLEIKSYLGHSYCRLCEKCDNGDSEVYWVAAQSNRKWTFPTGYFHYILEHNIEVPQEFIKDILENKKPNILYDNDELQILYQLLATINYVSMHIGMGGCVYSS